LHQCIEFGEKARLVARRQRSGERGDATAELFLQGRDSITHCGFHKLTAFSDAAFDRPHRGAPSE